MGVKGCRNETTGAISLGNEADKKNTGEWSSERGVINQMCFCIIGNLVFFVCVVFFLRGSLKTIKMHTNTARDELLSAVLVTGCVCEGNFLFIYF